MDRAHKTHEDMATLPWIVAVDFDGTLVEDRYPHIGEVNAELVEDLKEAKSLGHKIILWTCRVGKYLTDAVEVCEKLGLKFDAVNCNIEEVQEMFGHDTRKVYANLYIDDKATFEKFHNGLRYQRREHYESTEAI